MKRWEAAKGESGFTLLNFLKVKLGNIISGKQIKREIDRGKCFLNGRNERFSSKLVGTGDVVDFDIECLSKGPTPVSFNEKEAILYLDDDLIALDKPSGLSSDDEQISQFLTSIYGQVKLLHRLDKETTGVLLFGRNSKISFSIEDLFKKRLIKKNYLTIVDKVISKSSGKIECFLGKKHSFEGQTIWGEVSKEEGSFSKTIWELVKKGDSASLVRCFPETGRTHQIRIHMSSMGHPILGDYLYGNQYICKYRPQRILLHAAEIKFEHPFRKEIIEIKSLLPKDFVEAIHTLFSKNE